MSDIVHLDSILRDRKRFPNPSDFQVIGNRTGLTAQPRKVKANGSTLPAPLIYAWSVRPLSLTTPYNVTFMTYPHLYVDFHSRRENDKNLVGSINTTLSEIKFIFSTPSIQYSNNTPIWINWFCSHEQVMRFDKTGDLAFKITTDYQGTALANQDTAITTEPDPLKQVKATFQITPYIIDGAYSNNMANFVV